jgi:acyl carrier protein phosphodiesterase
MKTAVTVMGAHYENLQENFRAFYPQLEKQVEEVMEISG